MKYLIYNQNETQQTKIQKQEILYFLASDQSDQWDPTSQDEHGGVAVTFESSWSQTVVRYVRPGSEFTPGWEPDRPTVCSSLRVRPMLRSRPIVKLMFHWFKLGRADVSVGLSFTVCFFFYSRLLQIRSQTQKKKEVVWEICTKTKQEVTPFCFCCFWQRRWKDFQSCLINEIHIRLMTSSALIDK